MKYQIPVAEPLIGDEELRLVTDCIKSGWISSKGEYIGKFEEEFARYCGCKYGVAVHNGTVALHLALCALGVGKGDEVLVPDLTFVATVNAVIYTGAKPIYVDVHPRYWCIDPEKIEERITRRTKAIIPVHLYGHPCDMDAIRDIAEDHDLYVIEDAAEAHGAEYKGQKAGSLGDIACFSFYGNKIITTGEGGMCVTNNEELAEKMRLPQETIEAIKLAAEVHDIGKIHIPAEILSKPGQLSELEYNIIKTHPQVGYEVLKNIEFPWPIAEIVHQHHERLDGSGYPQGLKNDQILLEARIIAVADVVEAMASHRPYRPAKAIQEALQEIQKNKGKLYDPEVVEACLSLFKEGYILQA